MNCTELSTPRHENAYTFYFKTSFVKLQGSCGSQFTIKALDAGTRGTSVPGMYVAWRVSAYKYLVPHAFLFVDT